MVNDVKEVILTAEDKKMLLDMLKLTSRKAVIKNANYFNKKDGSLGNSCADFQNWMWERLGTAFKENLLNEKNRKELDGFMKSIEVENGGRK